MLNYTDIIRKTITAVPAPAAQPLLTPGVDFPEDILVAWVHPDNSSVLFLNALDLTIYELDFKNTRSASWLSDQLRSALLIDPADLVPEKHVLGGKQRKLYFNHTKGTPVIIDTLPIESRFIQRYSYKHCLIYQSMEKPHGYFFLTENLTPYAYVLPCRILLATAHDWRL